MDEILVYINGEPKLVSEVFSSMETNRIHRPTSEGPAICFPDGSEHYYENGKLHREHGPAIVRPNGSKFWYKHGLLHRLDGPAKELNTGAKEWWINGVKYSQKRWEKLMKDGYKG